ncbi:hypothetical protein [Novacetimonas hansenii]|uniref:hypothetical protein n=1 Tax=Novacetimonas hansenii TaxID=436 RepID=UPI001EF04495|nr:hypothetical protein [Novacetimonas hansenii]
MAEGSFAPSHQKGWHVMAADDIRTDFAVSVYAVNMADNLANPGRAGLRSFRPAVSVIRTWEPNFDAYDALGVCSNAISQIPRECSNAPTPHMHREVDMMTKSDLGVPNPELELLAMNIWNQQHPDRPWERRGRFRNHRKMSHALQGIPAYPEEQARFRFLASHAMAIANRTGPS